MTPIVQVVVDSLASTSGREFLEVLPVYLAAALAVVVFAGIAFALRGDAEVRDE